MARRLAALALLLAAHGLFGCGDSTDPGDGRVCFEPRLEMSGDCGLKITMLVAPACNAGCSFSSGSLLARHDFDNDGQWDTEYLPLVDQPIFDHITLPTDVWVVRSEVRNTDGSTYVVESSLDLPASVPSPPDIIAAQGGIGDGPSATIRVGQGWTFSSRAVHWMNSGPGGAIVRYYVDGAVVYEGYVGLENPLDPGCVFRGISQPAFTTAGTHELKVVWDVTNVVAETNETNNEIVQTLVVAP